MRYHTARAGSDAEPSAGGFVFNASALGGSRPIPLVPRSSCPADIRPPHFVDTDDAARVSTTPYLAAHVRLRIELGRLQAGSRLSDVALGFDIIVGGAWSDLDIGDCREPYRRLRIVGYRLVLRDS